MGFGKRSGKNGHGQQHSRTPEEHRESTVTHPKAAFPLKCQVCLECPPDLGFMEHPRPGIGHAGGSRCLRRLDLSQTRGSWKWGAFLGHTKPEVYVGNVFHMFIYPGIYPISLQPSAFRTAVIPLSNFSQLGAPQEGFFPGNALSICEMAAPDGFNLGSRPLSFLLASHSREQWGSLCSSNHLQQELNPSFFPIHPPPFPEKTPFSH